MAADRDPELLQRVEIALGEAKAGQRRGRVVVQQLAAIRDQLQSEEDTSGRHDQNQVEGR
jgi:hypothetical protein